MDKSDHYRFMPRPEGEEPDEIIIKEEIDIETDLDTEDGDLDDKEDPENKEDQKLVLKHDEEKQEVEIPGVDLVALEILYIIVGPMFVPTYAALFIFLLSLLSVIAPGAGTPYTLTVLGATGIIPIAALYVLRRIGTISSFHLFERKDRIIPYIVEFLGLGAMALFFVFRGAAPWIWTTFCGGAAVALINFFINFKIRISNHCSALAGLLAVLIVINQYGYPPFSLFWWVIGVVFFAGFAGSMAIIIGRHTIWEVLAGYATGFIGIILFSLIH